MAGTLIRTLTFSGGRVFEVVVYDLLALVAPSHQ